MTTTAQKIAVMQAFAEGKPIEFRRKGEYLFEQLVSDPVWNWYCGDYRVAETKPSINWDHVSKDYNYLAEDRGGFAYLYESKPTPNGSGWLSGNIHRASGFASFKPGTCDWKDSLVVRPGYEERF